MSLLFHLCSFVFAFQVVTTEAHTKASSPVFDLLTDGFGIVTTDDIAYDAHLRTISPFNPGNSNSIHWQCIRVAQTRATYSSWSLETLSGRQKKRERLCASEIQVTGQGVKQLFVIQHSEELSYCQAFIKRWHRLTEGQQMVCLNADFGELQHDKGGWYRLWGLEKYKTRLGCESYFHGACNTKGSAEKRKTKEQIFHE